MRVLHTKVAAATGLGLAILCGATSLFSFAVFLWHGSFRVVDLGLEGSAVLLWDAGLCLGFFVQHSVMLRRGFRARWGRAVPEHLHGAVYTIASGIALGAVVVLWQESTLYEAHQTGLVRQLLVAGWVLAAGILLWGFAVLPGDLLGVKGPGRWLRGRSDPPQPGLVRRGPYRIVRHPLYLACLLVIWASPRLTADGLLFDVLWTVWILVGTRLEERDLAAALGDEYSQYQREVPMIIPWRATPSAFAGALAATEDD